MAEKTSRSRYLFFAAASLSLLMFSIDGTIVAVALPAITRDLQAPLVWVGWTLTAYSLVQTVVMPVAGRLGESLGLLRLFFLSVLLFTVGSMLCGLAPSVYLLILARVIQALGGGGFLPLSAAIVSREFPESRQRMIGLFSSIFPLGGVIGPNLGGIILQFVSWREIFLVNVPIGLFVLVVLRRLWRPEARRPQPADVVGALTFAGAVFCLLSALTALGNNPRLVASPVFWAPLALSGLLVAAFWAHERRAKEPLVDPVLVVRHPFLAVNLYNLMFGACVFSFFSFVPYYAVVQFGMSPVESGAVLTPRSVVMSATATLTSLFLIRLGYRLPMAVGVTTISLALFLVGQGWGELALDGLKVGAFGLLALEMGLAGLGMGLAAPASNNAVLDLMPHRAGAITGLRGMFRSTGGVLGTALIVLVLELVPDRAAGLRAVFLGAAGILAGLVLPLVFLIPDSARERRRARRPSPAPAPHDD